MRKRKTKAQLQLEGYQELLKRADESLMAVRGRLNAEEASHNETRSKLDLAELRLRQAEEWRARASTLRSQLYIAKQLGIQLAERVAVVADAFGHEGV